jgi:hypothetical protein
MIQHPTGPAASLADAARGLGRTRPELLAARIGSPLAVSGTRHRGANVLRRDAFPAQGVAAARSEVQSV